VFGGSLAGLPSRQLLQRIVLPVVVCAAQIALHSVVFDPDPRPTTSVGAANEGAA
jgi:hypothetical protein